MALTVGPAAAATTATVVITAVLDVPGQPEQSYPVDGVFDAARLASEPQTVGGTYLSPSGSLNLPGGAPGVSLRQLATSAGVPPGQVTDVGIRTGLRLGLLAGAAGDLLEPGDPAFPFTYDALPLVVVRSDVSLYVGQRTEANAAAHPTLTNATYFSAIDGQTLYLELHLSSTLAHPDIQTATDTVNVRAPVSFTGTVDDIAAGNPKTWAWDFGDGGTDDSGSSVTHTFAAAGTYDVTATVTDTTNGSSGVVDRRIAVVDPAATSTTTTTPPPGPDAGVGGSSAPNVGPRTGSGARVGGAASGAPGRPGPTSDPRSASGAASGSGSAAAANGSVVGYLLSDAAQAAAAPRAAVVPRSNTAPAARAGLDATSLPGWAFGVAAVVLLAGLGAFSERRRPTSARARPRRKR